MSNQNRKDKRQKELVNLGRNAKETQAKLDEAVVRCNRIAVERDSALAQVKDQAETRIALSYATETIDTLREKLTSAQDEAINARIQQLELVDLLEKYRAHMGEVDSVEKENAKLRKRLKTRGAELATANTHISRMKAEMSNVC